MANLSDYLETALVNHIFGGNTWTRPGTIYFALFTTEPTDASQSELQIGANGYARVLVANNTTTWGTSAGAGVNARTTAIEIAFPQCIDNNWGEVRGVGIYDAQTGGNLLVWATLSTPKTINVGDTAKFAAGSFTFTLN